MPTFNRAQLATHLRRPATAQGLVLALAIVCFFASSRIGEPARAAWATALRPGQEAVGLMRHAGHKALAYVQQIGADTARLEQLEVQVQKLEAANRQLEAQAHWARQQLARSQQAQAETPPLLRPRLIPVNVLGQQARAYLAERQMLDAGKKSGVVQAAYVIDEPAVTIDQGTATAAAGQMLVAGSRVWGKVIEVGPYTSTVQRATDRGFRDLVQLGRVQGGQLHLGARGVLVGTGESLCRIEQIPTGDQVAVGDEVYAASAEGVLSAPLVYARVVRCQRIAGSAHWQVWAQPAVPPGERDHLALLAPEGDVAQADKPRGETRRR